MATFTSIFNLRKPATTELVNVATDLNENFDKLDAHGHIGTYLALLGAATGVAATDTATVQAALTAIPSTGGVLQGVPGKVYLINNALYAKSGTILRDVTLKRADNTVNAAVVGASTSGATALLACGPSVGTLYAVGTRGATIVLENCVLDGNKAGQTIPSGLSSSNYFAHNFVANRVDIVRLSNCRIINSVQTGVYTFGSSDVTVEGCTVTACGSTSANLDGLSRNGVSLSGNNTTDVGTTKAYRVTGCYITGAADEGVMYGYAQDVIISGNHIYTPGHKAIEGDSAFGGGTNSPGNVQIIGNFIRDTGQTLVGDGSEGIGISNADNQKIVIADNTMLGVSGSAIHIAQTGESTFNITGNIIEGVGGGYAAAVSSLHGIFIDALGKHRVAGNQIYDVSGAGVSCSGATTIDVVNNHFGKIVDDGVEFGVGASETFNVINASGNSLDTIDGHGISVGGTAGGMVVHLVANGNTMQSITKTGASPAKNGIHVATLTIRRLTCTGNVVSDQRSPADMGGGLDISGTASVADAVVVGNVFAPGTIRGFNGRNKVTRLSDASNIWDSSGGGAFRQAWRSSIPTASQGAFLVGDVVWNSAPTSDGVLGWVCVTAGTPGTWAPFQVNGYDWPVTSLLTTGESVYPRQLATSQSVASTTQNLRLTYFTARKTETITQVRMSSGSTAAGATPTLCRIGVWTADNAGALLAQVAAVDSDTALFAGSTTSYTKAFAASFDKVAGQRYAVGVLVVTGATAPTFNGNSSLVAAEAGQEPQLSGVVTGQSDLPSSVVAGSVTDNGNAPYFALLP